MSESIPKIPHYPFDSTSMNLVWTTLISADSTNWAIIRPNAHHCIHKAPYSLLI